jgi:hypothetical protein
MWVRPFRCGWGVAIMAMRSRPEYDFFSDVDLVGQL